MINDQNHQKCDKDQMDLDLRCVLDPVCLWHERKNWHEQANGRNWVAENAERLRTEQKG